MVWIWKTRRGGFKIPLRFLVYILGSSTEIGNTERARGLGKKWKSDFTRIELKILLRYSSGFIKSAARYVCLEFRGEAKAPDECVSFVYFVFARCLGEIVWREKSR